MKQLLLMYFLTIPLYPALAVNVKGPDGTVLAGFLIALLVPFFLYFIVKSLKNRNTKKTRKKTAPIKHKLVVTLEKNKLYFPEFLKLTVINKGNVDIDIDEPLLIFSNLWLRRKFRLKGIRNYRFYPLLLEPEKTHELNIDLDHFYRHDPHLKRFPRVIVTISEINSRYSVSQRVMLRKTLFR